MRFALKNAFDLLLVRDHHEISLLISSDFKRINYPLWNHQTTYSFLMISGGWKLINSLNIKTEIWRRSVSGQTASLLDWFNPFVPKVTFLDPLKTLENLTVFWCFQGVEKGCIGNKWVKVLYLEYFTQENTFTRCNPECMVYLFI